MDSTYENVKCKAMNFNYFIGIDVSKKTLDFCLLKAGKAVLHLQTENSSTGIESFIRQCKQQFDFKLEESLFCHGAHGYL